MVKKHRGKETKPKPTISTKSDKIAIKLMKKHSLVQHIEEPEMF